MALCFNKKKIVVLGTGGTIAGTADAASDNIGYTAARLGVDELLRAVCPAGEFGYEVVSEQVAQLDSKDMGPTVWRALHQRVSYWMSDTDVRGIVITHGTDTLEETAWFLQLALEPRDLLAKPVVLACAMRPASALTPDGPQNLMDALAVVTTPEARGVVAVCAGIVHAARDVMKVHPYRVNAFDSGDAGPLAYVEEGAVRMVKEWPLAPKTSYPAAVPFYAGDDWPWVELVMSYAGARGALVDGLVLNGVQGLVVASTGNGSLHEHLHASLKLAVAAGIPVVRATRCQLGRILARAGDDLAASDGLSPVKARISMMLALMEKKRLETS